MTTITSVHKLKSCVFNISGILKWNGEAHIPSEKTSQMVHDLTLIDSTGSIPLSVWGKAHFRHRRREILHQHKLSTPLLLWQMPGHHKTDNGFHGRSSRHNKSSGAMQPTNCCPQIPNVHVNSFLACNSKDCKKRVNGTPGYKILKCNNCSRSVLIKNCYVNMTVHFDLEKDNILYSVTAFPKALSAF